MGWLFKIEERDNDEERIRNLERLDTIRDIRRRIEKLRKDLSSAQQPITPRDEKVSESRQNVERSKENELNELKAKLLGRK